MKIQKLLFKKLGIKERKILLTALNFNINKLHCFYCKNKVNYKNCCIMPKIKKDKFARITCVNPLCISNYINDYEEFYHKKSFKRKEKNPMHYCMNGCGKYLGHRGFCCKKCHNEYYKVMIW